MNRSWAVAGMAAVVSGVLASGWLTAAAPKAQSRIDRHALVSRHDPVLRTFDTTSPLSVGNGTFAFTADVTGLQTFAEEYATTTPLGTLSQWGWHSFPNPERWSIDSFAFKEFDSHGRPVGYADIPGNVRTPEIAWLRANPHRLHLGRLGFVLVKSNGSAATPADLSEITQRLDLWSGTLISHFVFDGQPVDVETVSHPSQDTLAVRVRSPLLRSKRLAVTLRFPYGTGEVATADWTHPDAHETTVVASSVSPTSTPAATGRAAGNSPRTLHLVRTLDADHYEVAAQWNADVTVERSGKHEFTWRSTSSVETPLELSVTFAPTAVGPPASVADSVAASRTSWNSFWQTGGAIDLSGSRDPRWKELERRIVLSQYLTAIQCSGDYPPQETGLTFNSWEGKFHLEMHWWHAAHFALWDRLPRFERSLEYYRTILPQARGTAKRQGYRGARWPKMTSPSGAESPSNVGPFLVWQQPHPIFYAELAYRTHPDRATLERYRDVVFETAEFMTSYAWHDTAADRYVLGPPLQCAQEVFPKDTTANCSFELEYWAWGLSAAQRWRERLGLPRQAEWDTVLSKLSRVREADGKFLFAETARDTYSNPKWATDHPVVVGAFGLLPPTRLNPDTSRRTIDWIWTHWDWPSTWGWDYPMMAMAWARVGNPARAIDALLLDTPKNVYWPNGHNYQRPGLSIYLPGNGGLLYAVAMMAAGWDGGPTTHAPGFPTDGSWVVRFENLRPAM